MMQTEDLRGRHFTWHSSGETTILTEEPVEVGRLLRAPTHPAFIAEFAGLRLRLDHSVSVLGPTFEIRDADTAELIAKSHYTREAEFRAGMDGRYFALRHSGGVALWTDGLEDAVSLRANEAFVLMGADPRVAAPLLLLGIVMALENTLYPG